MATGVIAYELATGDIHVFHAKAIVIGTGGSGRIYKTTSNAHTLTGDGIGIVFRNGLPLEDMEFFQFHPTGRPGWASSFPKRCAARAAACSTARANASWSATRPPSSTWHSATSRPDHGARGAGRPRRRANKDYVYIDVRHLGADVLEAKLPDITEIRPHRTRRRPGQGTGAGLPDLSLPDGRCPHHGERPGAAR